METIVVDVFERPEATKELSKTLNVVRHNLVHIGLADYYWYCGHRVTLEHKTIEQVLTEMGGRLDDQLRKHSRNAEEVGLVIDGIATPRVDKAECNIWVQSRDGAIFYPQKKVIKQSWESLQAYLWQLDKEGFTIYQAPTFSALCLAISAFVYNSMKPEHKSLRRYVKTKPIVWEEEDTPLWHYIRTLMGLSEARIGEVTARKLLEAYGTPFYVYNGNPLDGKWNAGEDVFRRMQKAIGRKF